MTDAWTCCLCGAAKIGYGRNNPWPLRPRDEDCCNDCNETKVIPARLAQSKSHGYEFPLYEWTDPATGSKWKWNGMAWELQAHPANDEVP